eukprot:Rhum_TRINITY_DN14756_c15_g1::Rhum_TRINITY_DN14756_c15_g1_i1::g.114902::m.114902
MSGDGSSSSSFSSCPICLDAYGVGTRLAITRCEHVFHSTCLDQWFVTKGLSVDNMGRVHADCPTCRNTIRQEDVRGLPFHRLVDSAAEVLPPHPTPQPTTAQPRPAPAQAPEPVPSAAPLARPAFQQPPQLAHSRPVPFRPAAAASTPPASWFRVVAPASLADAVGSVVLPNGATLASVTGQQPQGQQKWHVACGPAQHEVYAREVRQQLSRAGLRVQGGAVSGGYECRVTPVVSELFSLGSATTAVLSCPDFSGLGGSSTRRTDSVVPYAAPAASGRTGSATASSGGGSGSGSGSGAARTAASLTQPSTYESSERSLVAENGDRSDAGSEAGVGVGGETGKRRRVDDDGGFLLQLEEFRDEKRSKQNRRRYKQRKEDDREYILKQRAVASGGTYTGPYVELRVPHNEACDVMGDAVEELDGRLGPNDKDRPTLLWRAGALRDFFGGAFARMSGAEREKFAALVGASSAAAVCDWALSAVGRYDFPSHWSVHDLRGLHRIVYEAEDPQQFAGGGEKKEHSTLDMVLCWDNQEAERKVAERRRAREAEKAKKKAALKKPTRVIRRTTVLADDDDSD